MRQTIFNAIVTLLQACTKFIGEDGTMRVYDWAPTSPAGYPFVVVSSASLESDVLDNASDMRWYNYTIQVVGEKFGAEGGMTQSAALSAMRDTEDAVLAIIDGNYQVGLPGQVVMTRPTKAEYGYTDGGGRVVLTVDVAVDTRVNITVNH